MPEVKHGSRVTLALLAATGALSSQAPAACSAEARARRPLDIALGGTIETFAAYGSLSDKIGAGSGRYDLGTDARLRVEAKGTDEATGLAYGAWLELKTGGAGEAGAEEVIAFVSGSLGELRLGDDAGVAEKMALGGFTVAVGSGGTDGDVISTDATTYIVTSDATKVFYFSPTIAGFQLGASFAPHLASAGQDLGATNDGELDDVLELGLTHVVDFRDLELGTSLVTALAHANDRAESRRERGRGFYGGLQASFGPLELAAGLGTADFDATSRRWFNIGVAWGSGILALSLNYGQVFAGSAPSGQRVSRPYNLVLGTEVGIASGVAASLELSLFDDSRVDEEGGGYDAGDSGALGLARMVVSY